MESGNVVKAIYEFKSDVEGELELQVGDIIQVIERVDRHWLSGVCNGKIGNFPSGFVMEVKIPPFEDGQAVFAAINIFIAQESGDLSFDRSDIIIGIEPIDSNWWRGKINEQIGIFPLTHVWALDTTIIKKSSFPKRVSMVGRVKMDMKAQLPEELDLRIGEHVMITEIVEKDWYRGECNGKTGLIPAAFVTIIDEGVQQQPQPTLNDNNQLQKFKPDLGNNFNPNPNPKPDLGNSSDNSSVMSSQFEKLSTTTPFIDITQSSPPIKHQPLETGHENAFPVDNSWLQSCTENQNNIHYGYDSLNSGITPYGRTLTTFRGEFPNELSFNAGELVRLMRHIDDYWLEGEIDGKIGLFPRKCVDVIVDCPEASTNSNSIKELGLNLNQVVLPNDTFGRVLFEFQSNIEGDLSLKEGDTITLLRKLNDNWYEATTDDGRVGLCPANYVEIIGTTRQRSDSDCSTSMASGWAFNQLPKSGPSSMDDILKLDTSSANLPLSRSVSISESSSYYDNSYSFSSPDSIQYKPRRVLKSQTSLPTLPSNDYFNDSHHVSEFKNKDFKPSHSRRSAPAAHTRFPDIVEDTGKFAESRDHRSNSILELSHIDIEKSISEKKQQKEKYERCRDKLNNAVERETDGNSPGALEFKRQIAEYDKQIIAIQTEISELNCKFKIKDQFKNEDERKRDTEVVLRRKQEDGRKAEERKRKNIDQRQCIITELLQTERDYLQDMQICQSIFLSNPARGKVLEIDMVTLFGNLDEVIDVSNRLLAHLNKNCKDRAAEEQVVGVCFVSLGDDLKEVYGHYCRNHDEVIPLLKIYESKPAIQDYINQGVEKIKAKTNCFDLQSILIKPVQRILKYPLLLNELLKCTEDSHPDKGDLIKSVDIMAEVAMAINEFKRRKDLVFKYRKDTDTSLSSRFSKLTLHSLRKKSSRISAMLSSSLGLTSVTKDEAFVEAEKRFQTVEKTLKIFLKDITAFLTQMQEFYLVVLNVAEDIGSFYQERKGLKEVDQLRSVHRIIFTQFWEDFKASVDKRVFAVVKHLLQMFHGPRNLIQKRHDKLLDYDAYESRLKSGKDSNKAKALQDEAQLAKNTYEALNTQLLDELPQLCSLSIEILHDCIAQFLHSRRIFIGRSAKEMLNLMELPSLAGAHGDILEVFKVKHNMVVDVFVQMSVIPKHLFPSAAKVDSKKQSPANNPRHSIGSGLQVTRNQVSSPQSPGQRSFIRSQYPHHTLYVANENYVASDLLDLSLCKGDIVGVIKKKDPMDNAHRWFVDSGVGKGFVPAPILSSLTPSAPPRLSISPQTRMMTTPSPDVTRYCNLPSGDNISLRSDNSDTLEPPRPSSSTSGSNWKNLLDISSPTGSKSSLPPSGQASPRYSEVDEFDPCSTSMGNPNTSYEELPNLEHRYEVMPGEEGQNYDLLPQAKVMDAVKQEYGSNAEPRMLYENCPGDTSSTKQETEYYFAKYAFSATGPNQLCLTQGQVVLLIHGCDLHGNSEWWFVEDRYGNQGYVPANYLSKYNTPG